MMRPILLSLSPEVREELAEHAAQMEAARPVTLENLMVYDLTEMTNRDYEEPQASTSSYSSRTVEVDQPNQTEEVDQPNQAEEEDQPNQAEEEPQPGPSRWPSSRLPSPRYGKGKDMAMARRHRLPSLPSSSPSASPPTPASQSSEGGDDAMEELLARMAEERTRRAESKRRAAGDITVIKSKLKKALDMQSVVKGEKKSLRIQRVALQKQLRELDERERTLDRREQFSLQLVRKYKAAVTEFNETYK